MFFKAATAGSCSWQPRSAGGDTGGECVPGRKRPDRLPARRVLRRRPVQPVPGQCERQRSRPAHERLPARRTAVWSPNSELIAFESTRRGDTDVYVVRPDGSSLKEITFSRGFDGDPAWNDDGSRIAFETTRNGPFDIYSVKSDGTDQIRLTTSPAADADPAWSPDGSRIAFMSERTGRRQVWI